MGPAGTISAAGPGTVSAPSITFALDTNTGLYNPASDTLGFSTAGVNRASIDSNGTLNVGSGDNPTWVSPSVGHLAMLLEGTVAAPVTTFGPTLKVARTVDVPGNVSGGDQSDRSAAIHAQAEGVGNCGVQPIALFGFARNTSTAPNVGSSRPDACAVYGVASIEGNGIGYAGGGFFVGSRQGTDPAATAVGAEIHVGNAGTTSDHTYNPLGAQKTAGIWMNSVGTARAAAGIVLGNGGGRQFDVGLAFSGQALGGFTGGIASSSLRDDSSSLTSLDIRGTHTTGLDLSNATVTNAIVMGWTHGLVGGSVNVNDALIGNTLGFYAGGPPADLFLVRDAASALAIRNIAPGTVNQTLRIYGSYTDGANFERLTVRSVGAYQVLTEQAGTGVSRNLSVGTTGAGNLLLVTNNTNQWMVQWDGKFLALTDNTLDIGAAGANRPHDLFLGRNLTVAGSVGFNSAAAAADLFLVRDGANVLALRNGTANEIMRFYKTFTDASNYERLALNTTATQYQVFTEQAGTGASRNLSMGTTGGTNFIVVTNNANQWIFQWDGKLLAATDNTLDIGGAGASRPRNVYIGSAYYTAMNTAAQGPGIWGGSGAPATGLGAVGDVFYRSDTPTTSLQRVYIKTAAAVWTGVV
jgi:hypothetical protein